MTQYTIIIKVNDTKVSVVTLAYLMEEMGYELVEVSRQ